MKIVSIEPIAGPGTRVRVHGDEGDPIELAYELLLGESLGAGSVLDAERMADLLRRDSAWRAREIALQLLTYRPRTAIELRRRLMRREIPEGVADECIAGLQAKGLVDDAAFAESFARDRIRLNPRGRRRVVQELRGRGVDAETASVAVDEMMRDAEVDDLALARETVRRWRPRAGEALDRARGRLLGFLARRGFSGETARTIVEETLPGE